ncbi:MAG TPA: hypothetical protein VMZ28_02230 [Kofleriaceae bacterium]|nr:hypothetical protein [Kofleriaceae bacterium]
MKGAAALAVALAVGGCAKKHWISHACAHAVSPRRDAIVYVTDDAVALRRADGEHRVKLEGCLAPGKDIDHVIALADGWRALAFGYRVHGGNIIESGEVEDTVECLIDFRAKTATPIDGSLFIDDMRHLDATVGAESGWVYVHSLIDPPRVVDVARGAFAELAGIPDMNASGAAIAERAGTGRVVTASYEQTDPSHPIYKFTIVVYEVTLGAWPPAVTRAAEIPVSGRADQLRISDDARWVAYSGNPWRPDGARVFDAGLVDLEKRAVAWELLAQPVELDVADVVAGADGPRVLALERDPMASYDTGRLVWLSAAGARAEKTAKVRGMTASWLPWRKRVLLDDQCDLDERDLPPP